MGSSFGDYVEWVDPETWIGDASISSLVNDSFGVDLSVSGLYGKANEANEDQTKTVDDQSFCAGSSSSSTDKKEAAVADDVSDQADAIISEQRKARARRRGIRSTYADEVSKAMASSSDGNGGVNGYRTTLG